MRRGIASNSAIIGTVSLLAVGGLTYLLIGMRDAGNPVSDDDQEVTLQFYCAAGLRKPVQQTIEEYSGKYPVKIQPDFGPTGALLSRIRAAKTGDLYLAADKSFVDLGRKHGVIAEALPIAKQKLVIAVAKGNPKGINGIADLLRSDVKYALCNQGASVGKLTKKILTKSGEWDDIGANAKVTQDTVNQITNSVLLKAVDAAIIWDANAKQHAGKLDIVETKPFNDAAQHAYICVLTSCKHPTAALRFCRFLQAPEKGGIAFARHGYKTIDGDPWVETPVLKLFSGGVNRIAVQDTVKDFEEREGVKINVAWNGCGVLVGKIKGGERPDAYFACDTTFMTQVKSLYPDSLDISETDMVIAVKKGNTKGINSPNDLTNTGLKIGVTNPKKSALGKLTVDLLERMKLLKDVKPNIVAQTPTADMLVTDVIAGGLDAVIVYRANLTKVMKEVRVIEFGRKDAFATQPIAICKETKYKYLTQRLIDAIRTAQSKERFLGANFRWLNRASAN